MIRTNFGMLLKLRVPFSRTGKFRKWLWKSFEFLFGKIPKYPKMDVV